MKNNKAAQNFTNDLKKQLEKYYQDRLYKELSTNFEKVLKRYFQRSLSESIKEGIRKSKLNKK